MADLDTLIRFHDQAIKYAEIQKIADIMTLTTCGGLLIPLAVIICRIILRLKDRAFLLSVSCLLTIGCLSGIATALCTQGLFSIG
jgi:hypothetical protein